MFEIDGVFEINGVVEIDLVSRIYDRVLMMRLR